MRQFILGAVLAALAGPVLAQAGPVEAEVPETEAACLDAGGRWAVGGLQQRPLCFMPTADAGKACTAAEDCTGFCLAETRTCSSEMPMFGCFALLYLDGAEVTICID